MMNEPKLPYEMMKLNTAVLIVPKKYQRMLNKNRVARIAADFDERVANEPKVSYRDGRYYMFDGNHTVNGRKLMNGGDDLEIFCKVYFGMDEKEEARLFAKQTGDAVPLTPSTKLRANVFGDEEVSQAFVEATEKAGVQIGYDRAAGKGRLICINTAMGEFQHMGAEIYTEALSIILKAWEGAPESFRVEILRGVVLFVEKYKGDYNLDRLVARLSEYTPSAFYNAAMSDTSIRGRKRFVKLIHSIYCGTSEEFALPVRF